MIVALEADNMINEFLEKLKQGDKQTIQRNRRLLLSISTTVLAKFIAIGSTLITMPLTLNYLGAESFGVWMVISGVIGFMAFTDLGIGMGLQNALSKAYGQEDLVSPKYYITNAYLLVSGLAGGLAILLFAIFAVLPIEGLFKINDAAGLNDAVLALKFSLLAFVVGMPVALIQRVLGGMQKTYIANNVMLVGSLMSLLAILIAVKFDVGLAGLAVMFILAPTLTLLVYSVYFFYKNKIYRPSISNISSHYLKPVVSAGAWTVFVQIIYTAKMNVPTIIISASLGLLAVAEYSVAQKLTALAATMIGMALQPLWVVYGEAYYRGDKRWVVSTLRKSLKLVLLLSVLAAIIFQLVGQYLISLWLGGDVLPSLNLILGFSLWMITSNINICFAMLLNGTGNFKNQAVFSFFCVGLMLVINKIFVMEFGLVGVIMTVFLVSELLCVPFYFFESKRVLSELNDGAK